MHPTAPPNFTADFCYNILEFTSALNTNLQLLENCDLRRGSYDKCLHNMRLSLDRLHHLTHGVYSTHNGQSPPRERFLLMNALNPLLKWVEKMGETKDLYVSWKLTGPNLSITTSKFLLESLLHTLLIHSLKLCTNHSDYTISLNAEDFLLFVALDCTLLPQEGARLLQYTSQKFPQQHDVFWFDLCQQMAAQLRAELLLETIGGHQRFTLRMPYSV